MLRTCFPPPHPALAKAPPEPRPRWFPSCRPPQRRTSWWWPGPLGTECDPRIPCNWTNLSHWSRPCLERQSSRGLDGPAPWPLSPAVQGCDICAVATASSPGSFPMQPPRPPPHSAVSWASPPRSLSEGGRKKASLFWRLARWGLNYLLNSENLFFNGYSFFA